MKRADRKRHHKKIKSLQETAYLLRSHANAKRLLAAIDSLKPAVKPARSNCEKLPLQSRSVFIPSRMIRSINRGYGRPAFSAACAKSSSAARWGFGFASMK